MYNPLFDMSNFCHRTVGIAMMNDLSRKGLIKGLKINFEIVMERSVQ